MDSGDIDCLNGMTEEALKELRGYQNLLEFWCDGVLISVIGQFFLSFCSPIICSKDIISIHSYQYVDWVVNFCPSTIRT